MGCNVRDLQMLTVHNVLASATLSALQKIDLDKCSVLFGNSYYNPAEFPALRIDVRGKRSSVYTISLFESGRIQSTGGCRPAEAKRAMMKIGRRLTSKLNYDVTFRNFEIQNVLAVFDACCPVNLGSFVTDFQGFVDYEPDRFPSARVRIPVPAKKASSDEAKAQVVDGAQTILENKQSGDSASAVSRKLRRLMMGDPENTEDSTTLSSGGAVGSYIITAGAKRAVSTLRSKEDKLSKEECVTANVFSTGKITLTGAKSISSLNYAVEKLKPALGLGSFNGHQTMLQALLPTPLPFGLNEGHLNLSLQHPGTFCLPPPGTFSPGETAPLEMSNGNNSNSFFSTPEQFASQSKIARVPQQEHFAGQEEQQFQRYNTPFQRLSPLGLPTPAPCLQKLPSMPQPNFQETAGFFPPSRDSIGSRSAPLTPPTLLQSPANAVTESGGRYQSAASFSQVPLHSSYAALPPVPSPFLSALPADVPRHYAHYHACQANSSLMYY